MTDKMRKPEWRQKIAESDWANWQVETRDSPIHCSRCNYRNDDETKDVLLLSNPELPRVVCLPCLMEAYRLEISYSARNLETLEIAGYGEC